MIMILVTKHSSLFLGMILTGLCLSQLIISPVMVQAGTGIIRVAPSGSDTVGCGAIASPCQTIQYAVNLAVSGDTILVASGIYTYNSAADTCSEFIGTTAVVCILNEQLTILGGYATSNWSTANPSTNVTIIDGQTARRGVILQRTHPLAPMASLQMEGFTIQNGLSQGASSGGDVQTFAFGGGMLTDASPIVLRHMIFKDNRAIGGNTSSSYGGAGSGGGLAIRTAPSGTILEHVTLDSNEARGGTGQNRGGLAIGGGLYTFQSVVSGYYITLTGNIALAGNSFGGGVGDGEKADAQGGGAGIQQGSNATLQYVSATGNSAIGGNAGTDAGGAFGGALYADLATLSVIDSDLRQNVALGGNGSNGGLSAGGGIMSANSSVTVNRVTLISNTATGGNGSSNRGAAGGGGAYFARFSGSTVVDVTNSIVADNLAQMGTTGTILGGGGGGLWLQGTQAGILHTTIARNRLGSSPMQGHGLLVLNDGAATASIANISYSIIADHTSYAGAAALHVKSGNTATLQRTVWAGNGKNTNAGDPGAGTINNSNPLNATSADFVSPGSPSYNYHILGTSPAKNQATGSSTAIDIDRESRALLSPPDIGADEYVPIVLSAFPVPSGSLGLNWKINTSLVTGLDHYNIVYSHEPGAADPSEGPSPINAGTQTSYSLTGLSNHKRYTMTIEARGISNTLIATSNTVTAFPTDVFVYLPIVLR